ncbi:MAG TPA: hypothetical protein VKV40_10860 [Ktedonobacteraceae bacterium]|nr:hypothetical protein [Ktedonobacteraceae bacterium]
MQQLKGRYPPNWKHLSHACKERAGWQCEHCHVKQHTLMTSAKGTPYIIYLHAAHTHHDPTNPQPDLIALCVCCHARYDAGHRQRQRRLALERRKHQRLLAERTDFRFAGG